MIADEVTDRCVNKEILLLCLRYVNLLQDKPTIQETFLDSVHVQGRSTVDNNRELHSWYFAETLNWFRARAVLRYMTEQVQWLAKVKERRLLLKDNSHMLNLITAEVIA